MEREMSRCVMLVPAMGNSFPTVQTGLGLSFLRCARLEFAAAITFSADDVMVCPVQKGRGSKNILNHKSVLLFIYIPYLYIHIKG
jgi:hypothetical protein